MSNRILKSITVILILLISILCSNIVFAAGNFTVNKSEMEITEGKTATFTVDGANATGKVEITSSDSSVATVSSASIWLEKSSNTITVTAKKAGTATITVKGLVADEKGIEDTVTEYVKVTVKAKEQPKEDKEENKVTNNTISNNNTNTNTNKNTNTNSNTGSGQTTQKPKEKSTNAYLSTLGVRLTANDASELGVETNKYDFSGFKKTTTSYNVTIPYEVDSLKVSYKAEDSNATVKVTGNSDFDVGSNNKITIKVTAEDGKTTKTYTIKVTKLAAEEEKPGNVIEDDEGLYLTSLNIDGIVIAPEFAKDKYAYTATLQDSNITEVNISATANKPEANIQISGNTNLVEGENTITILVKQENSIVQTVYQITLTKEAASQTTTTDTDAKDSNVMGDIMGSINKYVIIAVGLVLLMIIAVIVLIILLRKENKRLKNEENINTEEKEEYNVYENDQNEFENNQPEEVIIEQTKETETKNRRKSRREKGKHSK